MRKITTALHVARSKVAELLSPLPQNVMPLTETAPQTLDGSAKLSPIAPATAPAVEERYKAWISQHESSQFSTAAGEHQQLPTLSILLAVKSDAMARLDATLASLRDQTSGNWELIICDIAPLVLDTQLGDERKRLMCDKRIRFISASAPTRADALRSAIDLAEGDFVMTLEPGDRLSRYAVAALSQSLARDPTIDILYADEDVMEDDRRTAPQFKPEWSPELLRAYNYFGRPTLLRRSLIIASGSFAPDLGDACEWDLHLRLTEPVMHVVITPNVRRLPMVLCHRHPDGLNDRPAPSSPASQAFRSAITRHWRRRGMDVTVTTQPDGTQHATWNIVDPPLVSIIIPNRNQPKLLRACLDGLMTKTSYRRTEIIIVDNQSTDPETAAMYREAEAVGVRIVFFNETFNYARACNLGAAAAAGDLLLFLNNDIEIIAPDWLHELVRQALIPGVGVVGAKLLYPNRLLQHAGVVVGLHVCGLVFLKAPEFKWGPFGSPSVTRNWMAVMGACQLIRRDVFQRIHGFDDGCQIATSDVRLSLDAWRAGYRTVYAPMATLVHHEGLSRGYVNPEPDTARTAFAIRALGIEEDPYFHPALSATIPVPTLRLGEDPSTQVALRSEIERRCPPPVVEGAVDLWDDRAVALAAARPRAEILWNPDPPAAYVDVAPAARFVIDLFRRRNDLRQRFPRSLSGGPDGSFAQWLKTEACDAFGLPDGAVNAIDAAFRGQMAIQARAVLLGNSGLRGRFPLLLLPPGRRHLIRALFDVVAAARLSREAGWWLLLETAEDPSRELVRSWQLSPDWQQCFPNGITRFGRHRFALWLRQSFSLNEPWLDASTWPLILNDSEEIRLEYRARQEWSQCFPRALSSLQEARNFLHFLVGPKSNLSPSLRAWCASRDVESIARDLIASGVGPPGASRAAGNDKPSCGQRA